MDILMSDLDGRRVDYDRSDYKSNTALSKPLRPAEMISRLIRANTKRFAVRPRLMAKFISMVALGSTVSKAAEECKLRYSTALRVSKAEWFAEAKHIVKSVHAQSEDDKFSGILSASQDLILDSLVNGDRVLDKDGNEVRKHVTARDASVIMGIAFDKREIIRGNDVSKEDVAPVEDRLVSLMEKFTQIALANANKGKVIEAVKTEYSDVEDS